MEERAHFHFSGGGLKIEADVTRSDFEGWIAEDIARIEATVERALAAASVETREIDRVFLTGGTSLTPAIRALFERRFGKEAIASGGELTSVANGLALIAAEPDPGQWAA